MDSTAVKFLKNTPSYLDAETHAIIRVEIESEVTPEVDEFLRDLAATCAEFPYWFDPGGTIEATHSNIELEIGTNGVGIRSSDGLPRQSIQYEDFSNGSENQDRVSSLIDDFIDVVGSDESINIDCEITKQGLSRSIGETHDIAATAHVWTARGVLADWLETENPEDIEDQYIDPEQPQLLFIGDEDIGFEPESSWIAIASLSAVDRVCEEYTRPDNPIGRTVNYTHGGTERSFDQSQHPLLFNGQPVRDLFSTTFLHTTFRALSDESPTSRDLQEWEYTISNQDPPLTSVVDYTEYTPQADQLTDVFHLISGFHEVPTKNLQKYWLQAISRSCNSHTDIPNNCGQIRKYFDILEEGALQDTLAEATKTADKLYGLVDALRDDLTDLTRSVNNQVKTIIYGLVAAVITNTFLIIRWGDISQTLPFSLFIISIGLLAYFPITAAELRDTDKNIDQSISNFRSTYTKIYDTSRAGLDEYEDAHRERELIYSSIRSDLHYENGWFQKLLEELRWLCSPKGPDQTQPSTDGGHIEQKNAVVTAARTRVIWAVKYLHRLYVILAVGWFTIAAFSLSVYPPLTAPYIGAALSVIPAFALLIRDSQQYSSTVPFARHAITGVFALLLIVIVFSLLRTAGLLSVLGAVGLLSVPQ
ncbi:hypothetical protein [Halomarina rubra]|uniref:Uncharacterized protein n=1 Tax=Halomarina rubra TaxID=2071873 RepID=A0ABD6AYX1_9EURY|nr:hypothetical protein [Halomarina rubra]